ncbi:MAG: hypothetical protein WBD73_15445 [Candidatus Acidiferrales bacterium]
MIQRPHLQTAIPSLFCLLALVSMAGCGQPSDRSLETAFNEHESDLNKLVEMADRDSKFSTIAPRFAIADKIDEAPEKALGEQRWMAYESLFDAAGVSDGLRRDPHHPGAIFFVASIKGVLTGESQKGYVYSELPLTPTVDSLDRTLPPSVSPGPDGLFAFKPLKKNWYLFYYE